MSIMGNEPLINIEELDHIRQSNNRDAQYQLKRLGEGKFIISDKGKSVIGHNSTKGIDLRAGNGAVLVAVRPKDDERCTRGLLNGTKGKPFTSSKLEEAIEANLPANEFYDFEFQQEYQEGRYFSLIPSESSDDNEDDDPQASTESLPEDESNVEQAEAVVEAETDEF